MKMNIRSISLFYLFGDTLLIIFSLILGNLWLLNTQVAFISSMLITFASFFSYKVMIENRVENGDKREYREFFDEIEDPYRLFDEDEDEKIQEKMPKPKKRSTLSSMLRSAVSTISGALSIYRLIAYAILFSSILFLIKHNIFNPIAFFAGLSIVPVCSALSGIFLKSERD